LGENNAASYSDLRKAVRCNGVVSFNHLQIQKTKWEREGGPG